MRAGSGARVMLLAMGDLDFHKPIADRLRQRPAADLFANVDKRLAAADVRLANLETVIVRNPQDLLERRACLVAPLEALGALRAAGVDVVTFANNHVLDMGSAGLLECLGHLEAADIAVAGAGPDMAAARRPAVLARNGIELVVLAYSYGCGQIAGSAKPGCAEARLDWILEDLARQKSRSGLKIVCLHMDAEFQPAPAPDRVAMCRRIADAGADLVLCHHPHVVQGVEQWGTSLIAYSLGNYVTPVSAYMLEHSTECHLSFHLEVECDAAGIVAAEVVPVTIDEAGRPGVAEGSDRATLLTLIAQRSSMLSDEALLQQCYRRMVAEWFIGTARLLYWSIAKRDWFLCRRLVDDLRQTPTKRRWLLDFARHRLGSSPRYGRSWPASQLPSRTPLPR